MAVKLQLRYDTAANWTSNNPTLLAGEIGIESDTQKMKVGDGTTAWSSISNYAFVTSGSPTILTAINTTSSSFNLINTNATTLNIGGAATTLNIGATTGTTSVKNALSLAAGTTSLAPLTLTSGTNLTSATAGVIEYDGSFFYGTKETTSGRGALSINQVFRLAANGSNIGATIADFFGTSSSINLAASSVYEIEFYAYFTKNTAGTATWTLTASSAPTAITGYYIANPVTGIASGSFISGFTGSQASATAAFAATSSLTTAVNHAHHIKATVITNAATNFRLQLTQSAGTATPLAGSYYTVKRISSSQGSFA